MAGTEKTKPDTCRVCGVELTQSAAGRPRVYCSVECRRSVERQRRLWDGFQTNAGAWAVLRAAGYLVDADDVPQVRP